MMEGRNIHCFREVVSLLPEGGDPCVASDGCPRLEPAAMLMTANFSLLLAVFDSGARFP